MNSEADRLEKIFEKLKGDGFQFKSPLLWNFFFFSNNKNQLEMVIKELDGHNYTADITNNKGEYKLKASKKEELTSLKLAKRNTAFKELAIFCKVEYDGWEVEKP